MPLNKTLFTQISALISMTLSAVAITVSTAHAVEPSHYLFVGDLKTGTLLRYNGDPGASFGTAYGLGGNTSNPAYITGYGVTEGVHGTANTLITSQHLNGQWTIGRFNRTTGAYINKVTTTTFGGIGNIALTNDASTLYVPDEAGNKLYKIDVRTGSTLAVVNMSGVHDVLIGNDGYIYATGYNSGLGVIRYDTNLSNATTIIANGANGLTRPTGMTLGADGSLYVVQNTKNVSGNYPNGSVLRYSLSGGVATYQATVTNSLLKFGIGIDLGPDGNLYVAAPGNYNNFGGVNNVAKIDLTAGALTSASPVSSFITYSGTNNTTTYSNTSTNVIWPKYLKFDNNFASGYDPGIAIPEASTVGLIGAGLLMAVPMIARRRRTA